MRVWLGIDQGETWNELALLDQGGNVLQHRRVSLDPSGVRESCLLLRRYVRRYADVTAVAEGSGSLYLVALANKGIDVRTIHVITSAQWRRQHHVSGKKSDRTDAELLAEFARTQGERAQSLMAPSEGWQQVRLLARSHQELTAIRATVDRRLRSQLLSFYPAAVAAFPLLHRPSALVTLRLAPTPRAACSLRARTLRTALRAEGVRVSLRQAEARLAILRAESLRFLASAEGDAGEAVRATCRLLTTLNEQIEAQEGLLIDRFKQQRDWGIYSTFPALSGVLGARVFAEIGDDPGRFPSAKHLCGYAGVAPITRSSGLRETTHRRVVCNHRLNHALFTWTMPLLLHSPAAKALFKYRRDRGDRYATACRNVDGHYLRVLHHCLRTREPYDEVRAYATYANSS